MRASGFPPIPPRELPPARTVIVPGRGEFFLRDTGGDGPPVLLLHGWMVSADLNWCGAYDAVAAAGHRVLAIDHRGHGRGLRALEPFRLADCAADAAAVLRVLGTGPATVVGYSMGGAIAQLMARDHRDVVHAVVLSGTCQHFQDPATRKLWRWMGALRLAAGVSPQAAFSVGFRRVGIELTAGTAWWLSELTRHSPRDLAEAGRELGRFDSRPWLDAVSVPAAVVLTARDTAVTPAKQRELAAAIRAAVFEAPIDHLQVADRPEQYNPPLVEALAAVSDRRRAAA
ncbi:MAG: alpha/beta fold hydrolase [Solirubrobacteraceae bacterium]